LVRISVGVVAILKCEYQFVEEWLCYHRLLGVESFVLYDDDPEQRLRSLLSHHSSYVTVFDHADGFDAGQGRDRQTKAYEHAIRHMNCDWLAFIDGDEFIVLRKHENIADFVGTFEEAEAIVLTWHMFGHNGYYDDPPSVLSCLVRRKAEPGRMMKSIVRRTSIQQVKSAHRVRTTNPRATYDANNRNYADVIYPGKTDVAHINHYFCRSYKTWMKRLYRGCLSYSDDSYPTSEAWRYEEEACLRMFVEISVDHNQVIDEYMRRYEQRIREYLAQLALSGKSGSPSARPLIA
jgi:hypothetical protein